MHKYLFAIVFISVFVSCKDQEKILKEKEIKGSEALQEAEKSVQFLWEAANIYFLLTDRFNNGNTKNDTTLNRTSPTGKLRGFMGGDITGITKKIEEGYFSDLGINAIWFTPVIEQIIGIDKESEDTYGYHGYWARDWTALDPNFGTHKDLENLVKTAHNNGIRILMDVVVNHTGPETEIDPLWPKEWVRSSPRCDFTTYDNCTSCTLVNLPDIYTASDAPVALPEALLSKWKNEGRLDEELQELDAYFARTGSSRSPRAYIIKWLTDYVKEFGIDGYRVDTVKHADEKSWAELYNEASYSFEDWKKRNPNQVLDNTPFYMVGEVYGYGISSGRDYDFGDKKVDYFDYGFNSLINFELKTDAHKEYEAIFDKYNKLLHNEFKGKGFVNYLTSHDDMQPFDMNRKQPYKTANVLLLTPGTSQVYYGDESARDLTIENTEGDATLRSFMNWNEIKNSPETKNILAHWQKLGIFRKHHPSIGAGEHKRISEKPYVFSRSFENDNFKDQVVVALDLPKGKKTLPLNGFFENGTTLFDTYSKTELIVKNGTVTLENDFEVALLALKP